MKDEVSAITVSMDLNNRSSDGYYNLIKSGYSFDYKGKVYTYHSSGLCREVYKSDCGKFVIKVPLVDGFEHDEIEHMFNSGNYKYLPLPVRHNYYEYKAYEDCPKQFKKFLAKTELLPNCWIKQEFVEVKKCLYSPEIREIGMRKNGSYCIFDFDEFFAKDMSYTYRWYRWETLPFLIKACINSIKELKK